MTKEVILQYETDGDSEWGLTRKEELTRCGDCIFYREALLGTPYGYCRGRRKFDTGYCDEAVRRKA